MPFDGLTLRAVRNELNTTILNGKIEKIIQAEKDEILLQIHNNRKKFLFLMSANTMNPRCYLTSEYTKQNPLQAPTFLMLLRKHLKGGFITAIEQFENERILSLTVQSRDELQRLSEKELLIEIMGKHSNIILIDRKTKIIFDSIKRIPIHISSVRQILPNMLYELPPGQDKTNPFVPMSLDRFVDHLNRTEKKNLAIHRLLIDRFQGISLAAASEIVFRAGLDEDLTIQHLNENCFQKLYESFQALLRSILHSDTLPTVVLDPKHQIPIDFFCDSLSMYGNYPVYTDPSISAVCDYYFQEKDRMERMHQKTSSLKKKLNTAHDRLRKKLTKQLEEMKKTETLEKDKEKGELLTANIYRIEKGMDQITLQNFYDPNVPNITISLDKNLEPSQNIQRYFKRYKKLKNRKIELEKQIRNGKNELQYLANVLYSFDQIQNEQDLEEIKEELISEQYLTKPASSKKRIRDSSVATEPYAFLSSDGDMIYVGRNNIQNDRLTFRLSSPDDIWLHVKDAPGSHVIIKKKADPVSERTLLEAAQLAIHYSKLNKESKVEVDYTERKHVRKPKNAKPGMVIYDRQHTIVAASDPVIAKLLQKKG